MSRKNVEKKIAALLKEHGAAFIPDHSDDLFAALEMSDAAVLDLMDAFAQRFTVDMTRYLPALHVAQDTANRNAAYLSTGQLVPRLPITIDDLTEAAKTGAWQYRYPDHSVKTVGWRDILQYVLIAAVALWIAASFFL